MKLLEWASKEVFKKSGIPTQTGKLARTVEERFPSGAAVRPEV